jgi:tetratricopeptide (TPR) repeat protein
MKIVSFIIAFVALSNCLFAQNVKRGFKSLEKQEYDKAKDAFDKILLDDSQNVAANFGMAMIMADDKSPFFDIVDAWKYIVVIKGHENELVQDDIETLGEYFLNTEVRKTSRPVKKKVEIAEDAVEARLIKFIREENNLDAVYRVLELYPDFKDYDNVLHIRNQFEYRKYEKTNTLAAYEEFIKKFPDAAQIPKAVCNRNRLAFDAVKIQNTAMGYNKYIHDFPQSEYLQQAIKLRNAVAYADAVKVNKLEAYQEFIKLYPDALEIAEARKMQNQLMYEKAKRIKTIEAYNEFISMYPDGAYYLDVFNLKAGDLGMQDFRQLGFDSPDLKWSKTLDNNQQIENAESIAVTSDGGYIIAGTTLSNDTSYSDAWIVKLDSEGKMLWNKTVGQPYNDEVFKVLVDTLGEIIIIGYTQAIADSNSYTGWMFKLGSDGKKRWNKNLGAIRITAAAISPDNKIYLATHINDTIPNNYYLQAFTTDGIKVWERIYVKKGNFTNINFTQDEHVLLTGSDWLVYADSRFYIVWEDTLSYPGSIFKSAINSQNIVIVAADSLNRYQLMYDLSGHKLWKNSAKLSDNTEILGDIILSNQNACAVSGNNSNASYLISYDTKGAVLREKQLNNTKFKLVSAIKGKSGEFIYLFKGEDYLVVSFSSIGF